MGESGLLSLFASLPVTGVASIRANFITEVLPQSLRGAVSMHAELPRLEAVGWDICRSVIGIRNS